MHVSLFRVSAILIQGATCGRTAEVADCSTPGHLLGTVQKSSEVLHGAAQVQAELDAQKESLKEAQRTLRQEASHWWNLFSSSPDTGRNTQELELKRSHAEALRSHVNYSHHHASQVRFEAQLATQQQRLQSVRH